MGGAGVVGSIFGSCNTTTAGRVSERNMDSSVRRLYELRPHMLWDVMQN